MRNKKRLTEIFICLLTIVMVAACHGPPRAPDLGGLYNELAQNEDPYRNPVILIPGILGSKLIDRSSGSIVWGTFGFGNANPKDPAGARLIALPMAENKPLSQLQDNVYPSETLDRVVVSFGGYPLILNTYAYILGVLGVGGYRDQQQAQMGVVDWGDDHFTCFQFAYDWRRDIVESARKLDQFIKEKKNYVEKELEKRFGITDHDVKFDIVAHSMGGLVARYYMRYGDQDLPSDGSLPQLNWAGSEFVDRLVMVGTPNGGTLDALLKLVEGYHPALLLPRYPSPVIATMPSLYEMLPRNRHGVLLDDRGRPVDDILDPELWHKNNWGLADSKQDKMLQVLLPDEPSPSKRRQIAAGYLAKVLQRARHFQQAMDIPAKVPGSVQLYLVAGDAISTDKVARLNQKGSLQITQKGPGDSVVLRSSALLDERRPDRRAERLISPINWEQVFFLFSDHRDITDDPVFTDNLLYILLESPRNG
jgi:pimeloyl-ACP methyl ester carboxylesterase